MANQNEGNNRDDRERRRKANFRRQQSEQASEIGPYTIKEEHLELGRKLREECKNSLRNWNVKVFPQSSGLKPLGQVQLDSIAHDESVIVGGGKICKAEPRGFGKTTRSCNAALWAALYGYRQMVPVFSANLEKSKTQIMARWRAELYGNDLIYWMFPELIWPIRALENKPQRCASQTWNGEPTHIQWTADRIVLPNVAGEPGAGAVLIALPLKSCRGATHTKPDGTILRPDLIFLDDVQKDEDADNPNTVRKTEELIDHTAMMLGGHSRSMSAIMACTVRKEDDLSETYLKKSSWRRVRFKMLAERATQEKDLWLGKYAEIRKDYNPEDPDDQKRAHQDSLEFYKANREAMDEGAVATWEWAFQWGDDEPLEISAIQHAYNILIDLGESVFSCEGQNEPLKEDADLEMLSPMQICRKVSGYKRNEVPKECSVLTAAIDVHPELLYWHVWAWEPGLTGYKIDDGIFPEQGRRLFAHKRPRVKLSRRFPGHDLEARVMAALRELVLGDVDDPESDHYEGLLCREWTRTDGVPIKIGRLLIDANGEAADTVKKFIRRSGLMAIIEPSFGRGITAKAAPISRWTESKGKGEGPEWVRTRPKPGDPLGIVYDTNYWKTKWHRAMALPAGSRGALYVYSGGVESHHLQMGEHCNAEKPKLVSCGSRQVFEWTIKPNRDNHEFDVSVMSMVGASRSGINSIAGTPKKKSLSLAALQARKRQSR